MAINDKDQVTAVVEKDTTSSKKSAANKAVKANKETSYREKYEAETLEILSEITPVEQEDLGVVGRMLAVHMRREIPDPGQIEDMIKAPARIATDLKQKAMSMAQWFSFGGTSKA